VEWSASSKMEEKPTSSISVRRDGYVGAQTTLGVMGHIKKGRIERRKPLDDAST
jgi:hypothetical protein